jgi:Zn-dependent protease with chaperone function
MVSLRYFVLVLLTVCSREVVAGKSGFENPYTLPLALAFLMGMLLLAKFAALKAVHGATLGGLSFDWLARELFSSSRRKIEYVWCYASPLALVLTGWIKWTCSLEQAGWPQSLTLLLCFAPSFVFLVVTEMIASQVDRVGRAQYSSTFMQTWLTRIRLGEVAGVLTCLLPVVLLSLVSDVSQLVSATWGVQESVVRTFCTILIAGGFILLFPLILTNWSGGKPIQDALGNRVAQLVHKSGVIGIRSVMIHSNHRWAGAAVVGWVRGFRRLWLGDGLVGVLTDKEVDMVVLHEMAHIVRFHFFWRLMPVVWAMAAGTGVWLAGEYFGLSETIVVKLFAGLLSSWLMLAGLGSFARRCELDADSTACSLALVATDWAASQSPAAVLSSALSKLIGGSASADVTWLHPSLDQRLESLNRWNNECLTSAVSSV